MKKIFALFIVAGMFSIVACGPSAEELAAEEQRKLDSLEQVRIADSILAAELEQWLQDSIAEAEAAAAAAAAKAKPSTPKQPGKTEPEKETKTGEGGRRAVETKPQETGAGGRRTGN